MTVNTNIVSELLSVRDWLRYGATCFEKAQLFYGHGTNNAWDEAAACILAVIALVYFDNRKRWA